MSLHSKSFLFAPVLTDSIDERNSTVTGSYIYMNKIMMSALIS